MNIMIANYLAGIKFGEVQQFENMAVIPLFYSNGSSLEYLTLKEALEKQSLVVEEVDQGGSVPELRVINQGDVSVILLDGEELVGAKQNRVLNTTVLLRKHSETIIPVSCTEQGRWAYTSKEFANSEVIVSPKVRRSKVASVTDSLEMSRRYDSDQGDVWDNIQEMSFSAGIDSPTGAMRDVFESREKDLDSYLKAFPCQPRQKGLLVFINGEISGFDILSLESAYGTLHLKLVKSYALDALLQKKRRKTNPSIKKAQAFLERVKSCSEKKYKSIGKGWDYRFEEEKTVGSALVFYNKIIHLAFFATTKSERVGTISRTGQRRHFRL